MRRKINNDSFVITPCVGICKIDESGSCLGCKRTRDEISEWFWMEDSKKIEIMEQLKCR